MSGFLEERARKCPGFPLRTQTLHKLLLLAEEILPDLVTLQNLVLFKPQLAKSKSPNVPVVSKSQSNIWMRSIRRVRKVHFSL